MVTAMVRLCCCPSFLAFLCVCLWLKLWSERGWRYQKHFSVLLFSFTARAISAAWLPACYFACVCVCVCVCVCINVCDTFDLWYGPHLCISLFAHVHVIRWQGGTPTVDRAAWDVKPIRAAEVFTETLIRPLLSLSIKQNGSTYSTDISQRLFFPNRAEYVTQGELWNRNGRAFLMTCNIYR